MLDRGDLFGRQRRLDTRLCRGSRSQTGTGRRLRRRLTALSQPFGQLLAEFFCCLSAMGLGALPDKLAVVRSPNPFGAVAAAPGFVAGILTTGMVASIDRQHGDSPTSARLCSIC